MPPHSAYFTDSVTVDVCCQHSEPCYSSNKGPQSEVVEQPVVVVVVSPVIHSQRSRTTKSVSFNEVVRAKKTMHISNFTAEEIRCCWYKEEEYEVMKQDLRFEVNLLENDCVIENTTSGTNHTARGLEMFSSTIIGRARREIKSQARTVVLEEQRLQREEGSYDPEFIAEVYVAVTKAASQIAIQAAC
jgi:hypothetical protein